jgi:hypothetical protein
VNSRRDKDVRAGRLAVLLGGVALGMAATALAEDRGAVLLQPRPAKDYVPRASGADLNPDELPPAIPTRPRDADFQYPPTYSENKHDFPELNKLWTKISSGKIFGSDSRSASPVDPTAKPVASGAKTAVASTTSRSSPVRVAPPAWHWYGYGAPAPGVNPPPANSAYAVASREWYQHTGATPGAIPRVSASGRPAAGSHPFAGPPLPPVMPSPDQSAQTEIAAPVEPPLAPTSARPAEIDMPIRPAGGIESDSKYTPVLKPLSSRPMPAQARAQAPEAEKLPANVIAGLRSICTGSVEKIEVTPHSSERIALRLKLTSGADADRLSERIIGMPELAGFQIEMQFER